MSMSQKKKIKELELRVEALEKTVEQIKDVIHFEDPVEDLV